jgi:hypothetical protein
VISQNFQDIHDNLKQFIIVTFVLFRTVIISISLATEDLDGRCFSSLLFRCTISALSASRFFRIGHMPLLSSTFKFTLRQKLSSPSILWGTHFWCTRCTIPHLHQLSTLTKTELRTHVSSQLCSNGRLLILWMTHCMLPANWLRNCLKEMLVIVSWALCVCIQINERC